MIRNALAWLMLAVDRLNLRRLQRAIWAGALLGLLLAVAAGVSAQSTGAETLRFRVLLNCGSLLGAGSVEMVIAGHRLTIPVVCEKPAVT